MATYWTNMAHSPTCVYRIYGSKGGDLEYVGISRSPQNRYIRHRRTPWWPEGAYITEEWFDNRTDALRAEREAILTERPTHNVTRPVVVEVHPHG